MGVRFVDEPEDTKMNAIPRRRILGAAAAAWAAIFFLGAGFRVLADCASFGLPFTDLGSETMFCASIAEAYYTGITAGTSATTFSPNDNLTRAQGAAFATRTLDAALTRGSRRAALGQWWTTGSYSSGLGIISFGSQSIGLPQSDGSDIWVPIGTGTPQAVATRSSHTSTLIPLSDSVVRVRASDGKVLETWTGASGALAALVAMGRVFVTGTSSLYMLDPSQPAGPVTVVASIPGDGAIAFDGTRIWTTHILSSTDGNVSIITPGPTLPWSVTTIATGFPSPGIAFDGHSVWVSDPPGGSVDKLDQSGNVVQSVPVPPFPVGLTFDGTNLWVTNAGPNAGSVSVVRARDGKVLKTLTGNGLSSPFPVGFDGGRIMVGSTFQPALSLFDATSLEPLGFVSTLSSPLARPGGICSDGVNFWITSGFSGALARF
jgi:DNA-binding beta-propeller fold protein YncE